VSRIVHGGLERRAPRADERGVPGDRDKRHKMKSLRIVVLVSVLAELAAAAAYFIRPTR
jgi:hypothetical protein